MKINRAYKAGVVAAESISEMVNLMYQENTAFNFFKGFSSVFIKDYSIRKKIKLNRKKKAK